MQNNFYFRQKDAITYVKRSTYAHLFNYILFIIRQKQDFTKV